MSVPELRHVRVFLTLCEELSFARTGEVVGMTTSRVSQVVREMELKVGAQLFERSSRRVNLTPLGELLRAELAPGVAQIERAFRVAEQVATPVSGSLRVGMYTSLNAGPFWREIAERFAAEFPATEVLTVDTGWDALAVLRDGGVDVLAQCDVDPAVVVGLGRQGL